MVSSRHTVTKGSGDRDTEARRWSTDPKVAGGSQCTTATRGHAIDLCDRRLADGFETVDYGIKTFFIVDTCVRGVEVTKLSDIGTRHKRFSSSSTQDQHLDGGISLNAVTSLDDRLVHFPRHRVASLRSIEGQEGKGAVLFVENMVGQNGFSL